MVTQFAFCKEAIATHAGEVIPVIIVIVTIYQVRRGYQKPKILS